MFKKLSLALFLSLSLAACDDDPAKDFAGSYDIEGIEGAAMHFREGGVLEAEQGGQIIAAGTWALKDGKLEMSATPSGGGEAKVLLCDYELKDGSLTISGEGECAQAPKMKKRA